MSPEKKLIEAIKSGENQIVQNIIITRPTLLDTKMENGVSILMLAAYYRNTALVQFLVKKKTALSFFESAAAGQLASIQSYLQKDKALINTFSVDGFTVLGLACFFKKEKIVKYLLAQGADVNIASNNDFKVAPLHSVATTGNVLLAKLLLQHGADINAQQQSGVTVLHSSAHNGFFELVKLLLENNANPNLKMNTGQTPLDMAIAADHKNVVELLSNF